MRESIKTVIDSSTIKLPSNIKSAFLGLKIDDWAKGYQDTTKALNDYIKSKREELELAKKELKIQQTLSQLKNKIQSEKTYIPTPQALAIRQANGELVPNINEVIRSSFEPILREFVNQGRSASQVESLTHSFWGERGLVVPKIDYASAFSASSKGISSMQAEINSLTSPSAAQLLNLIGTTGNKSIESYNRQLENLARATRNLEANRDALTNGQTSIMASLNNLGGPIDAATDQWNNYTAALRTAVVGQRQLDSGFNSILGRLKYFLSFTTLFTQLRKQITQTFKDVQQLDKSFAQIAMVTRYSVNDMWGSYERYAEMANELGQATNDVVQASALYYQQGLDTNEVLSLTENTMKLATLASIDFSEATDLMTAALRGFKLEMTESSHITDVYSELAAHAAASVQEIAVAMNKTAAIANSAGMSFENTAAFLTQMIEATQETASNIGTAMKTVIARFTELKENVDELDEDFEDLEYNKIDKALKSVGVNLKDQNGQFRNLDDVFIELSSRWQSLTRNQQRYIATTAAGSRQQSRFIALIDNYARTMELVETASDSEGRSSQQFEKYANSVEYSIKKLQNTWEQLRVSLLNSDFYKDLIETANTFVEKISHFDKLDWSSLLLAFATLGRMSMHSFFTGAREALSAMRPALIASFDKLKTSTQGQTADFFMGSLGARRYARETARVSNAFGSGINKIDARINTLLAQRDQLQRKVDLARQRADVNSEFYDPRYTPPTGRYGRPNQLYTDWQNNERQLEDLNKKIYETRQERWNQASLQQGWLRGRRTEDEERERLRGQWNQTGRANNAVAAGAAAGAAFTGAFTAAMLSDDPSKVFWSGFISGGITAAPQIVNTFNSVMSETGQLSVALGHAALGGLMSLAVSAAVAGAVAAYKVVRVEVKKHQEEILKETDLFYNRTVLLEQLQETEEELGRRASKSAQTAEASATAYEKLASTGKELKELQDKVILTSEEQEKLIQLSNEMAEIAPSLVSKYDEEGNAVINLADNYDTLLKKKQRIAEWDALYAAQDFTALDRTKWEEAVAERERQVVLSENKDNAILKQFLANPQGLQSTARYYAQLYYAGTIAPAVGALTAGAPGWVTGLKALDTHQKYDYTLNDSEKSDLGSILKVILKNEPEFAGALTGSNADIVDNIQKQLEESPDLIIKINKALEDFAPDLEFLDYQIKSLFSSTLLDKKEETRIKASLQSDFFGSQTDKNVQEVMLAAILGDLASEESIRAKYSTENQGATPEDDWEAFSDWLDLQFQKIKIDENKLTDAFTEDVIGVLSQIKNLKLNLPQLVEFMQKNLPNDVYKDWLGSQATEIAAYNSKLSGLAGAIGNVSINKSGDIWSATGQYGKLVEALMYLDSASFSENLEKWKNADRKNEFLSMFESVSTEDLSNIFNFDWKKVSSKNYQEQIDALEETVSVKKPQLEKILSSLGLTDFASRSLGEFEEGIKKDMEDFKKFDKSINAVRTAGTSWAKDGKVSAAGIEALVDQGYDISKIVSQELQFNREEALKQTEEQIEAEYQSLKLKMAANQELLEQYEIIKKITGEITAQDLQKQGITPDLIDKFFIKGKNGYTVVNEVFDAAYDAQKELVEKQAEAASGYLAYINARRLEMLSAFKDIDKEQEDSAEKRKKAEKAVADAYQDVLKKQQDVIDKQKQLNEVLYGEDFHKNKLDELYNYSNALEVYTDAIKEAKDELDNLEGRSPAEFLNEWFSGAHSQAVNLTATNNRYDAAIKNTQSMLENRLADYLRGAGMSSNVSDFFYYDPTLNRYGINYGALNNTSMNDSLRDFIEEQVDLMNQYKKNIKKNQDDLKNLEKEFRDYQRKVRDDYISVQEEVAKKLEEFYRQQVDDKKEMYDALEEADNEYLDALQKAIEKQRKLREKEEKWNDLATKEKRLSLLQRDTSGANQKTVQNLRKDINKDRQSLLDNSVDTIVNNLKELYEMQQETRETELEYQENLLENSNYIAEANSLLQSWKTVDEMRDWMWAHTQDIDQMSDEAVEKLTEDWATMFDSIQTYNEMSQREITSIFDVSSQEVQDVVINTSEALTGEADRAFGEITTSVNEAIDSARRAVEDAMKSLADAQESYNEKLTELNEILSQTTEIARRMADFMGVASSGAAIPYGNNMAMDAYNAANRDYENWKPMDQIIDEANQSKTYLPVIYNSRGIAYLGEALTTSEQTIKEMYGSDKIYGKDSLNYYAFRDEAALNSFITGLSMQDRGKFRRFKAGGLANYTGLAYVDGTPNKPEAFLNAEDTARIGEAASIFRDIAQLGSNSSLGSALSNISSESNATVNIFVDSIATEEQVDYLIDRMKEEFVNASNPIGGSIILRQ